MPSLESVIAGSSTREFMEVLDGNTRPHPDGADQAVIGTLSHPQSTLFGCTLALIAD
jgi:hypothetical protein